MRHIAIQEQLDGNAIDWIGAWHKRLYNRDVERGQAKSGFDLFTFRYEIRH